MKGNIARGIPASLSIKEIKSYMRKLK